MIQIYDLRDRMDMLEAAVQFFWKQWGSESSFHFYRDCMEWSCKTDSDLPRFYISMDESKIMGSYALLRSDLSSRQDLFPWFACLYVEPEYRGQQLGKMLQDHAISQARDRGYQELHLCTDLVDYYEHNGWKRNGESYSLTGEMTRVYTFNVTS